MMNPAASDERTVMPFFFWTGRFRRAPPDVALSKCSCENVEKQVLPLDLLQTAALSSRNSQKRLVDDRYPMKPMRRLLQQETYCDQTSR
ncbi:hypothetical protein PHMEG_00039862 [Phytophthora megakarya]|uniref:Uncharacterized protein n=1 Tax=Phytophthora megakarya TaxID=4795 RepID=A0A225UG24_9STRA|nr:hypothetical protein PHMEG_00039862 [Phytophthora megakarya]